MTTRKIESQELISLIEARDGNEAPDFIGDDDRGNELFRFADGTEVIVTNAGLINEDEDGFIDIRSSIVGWTEEQIAEAVNDYAIHHEVEIDEVDVTRRYCDGKVIGFRLSLDVDGRSHGEDERYDDE